MPFLSQPPPAPCWLPVPLPGSVLTGAWLNANKSQAELNEHKMEIIDDYEKYKDKCSTDEDRVKCEAKLKGARGLKPGSV